MKLEAKNKEAIPKVQINVQIRNTFVSKTSIDGGVLRSRSKTVRKNSNGRGEYKLMKIEAVFKLSGILLYSIERSSSQQHNSRGA